MDSSTTAQILFLSPLFLNVFTVILCFIIVLCITTQKNKVSKRDGQASQSPHNKRFEM